MPALRETLAAFGGAAWGVTLELAPWLLLGAAIAGILHGVLPPGFVRRRLSGRAGVVRAVALGVPLPLCSCGVIPTGLGLKRDGASDGAVVGFLISTPQTGVDSILVSASFLGWPFALFKVVAAAITGIVGGWVADRGSADAAIPVEQAVAGGTAQDAQDAQGTRPGAGAMVAHAIDLLRSIWPWLVVGVAASAAIEAFVPERLFTGLGDMGPLVPILVSLLISLPLYVCATASVPIAASLVAGGMPGGAALVFLMAGPATNLATIGAVYRALGGRTLAAYLGTIVGGSVAAGLLFDSLLDVDAVARSHVHGSGSWWATASATVLLGMIGVFAAGNVRDAWRRVRPAQPGAAIELGVDGMTCQGCVAKLERALLATEGISWCRVSLEPGRVSVRGGIDQAGLAAAIERAGYAAAPPGVS